MRNIYCFIVLLIISSSCEQVIDLDLEYTDPRIVIEGIITDHIGPYTIKITRTKKYNYDYDTINQSFVENALVIVRDDIGNIDTLTEAKKGVYRTHENKIAGQVGRSYSIEIMTQDGKTWVSKPERMMPLSRIESLYFERDINDRDPNYNANYKFSIYMDWKDSANIENYYLRNITYKWGGVWRDNVSWNWTFNDKYIDGNYLKKDLLHSAYGGKNFVVRLKQYSLTKPAYQFWKLIQDQTAESDETFTNTSIPLYGNVYNANDTSEHALGYFQVSSLDVDTVYINQ